MNNNTISTARKFAVFVGTDMKRSDRLILNNARKQMRSTGRASFTLIRKTRLDQDSNNDDISVKTMVYLAYGDVETGDTLSNIQNILWRGEITDITKDIFYGGIDAIGTVIAEEIGTVLSTKPLVYGTYPYASHNSIFNPFVENEYYGNKDADISDFRVSDFASCKADAEFLEADKDKVWTLEEVIKYVASAAGISNVVMPWEIDNISIQKAADEKRKNIERQYRLGFLTLDEKNAALADLETTTSAQKESNKKKYGILLDYKKPRSYSNYEGKPITDALDELIEHPLNYYFDPTITNAGVYDSLVIINESPVEISNVVPARAKLIMNSNENTTEVNISENESQYDEIIVRGNNILFAGTFQTWSYNQQDTLAKDWTTEEEEYYIAGGETNDGQIGTIGGLHMAENQSSEPFATAFRQQFKNVYTNFKFNSNAYDGAEPRAIQIHKDPLSSSEQGRIPFFPWVKLYEDPVAQTFKSKPVVYYTWGTHQTPDVFSLKWADKLPFSDVMINGENVALKDKRADPFAVAIGQDAEGDCFFFNMSYPNSGGTETVQLSFYTGKTSGIKVQQKIPETCAKSNQDLFKMNDGVVYSDMSNGLWDDAGATPRNPNTTDYDFVTHWGTYLITVAGYSSQKLELKRTRAGAPSVNRKTKIIEDASLELWLVHPGTVKGISDHTVFGYGFDNHSAKNMIVKYLPKTVVDGSSTLADQPTIIRNDLPKARDLMNSASAWYFLEKRSLKYEEALMNYAGGWNIGDMIGGFVDGGATHNINTLIESIDYDANSDKPRIIISTAQPEVPILTRISQAAAGITPQQMESLSKATSRTIEAPKAPVIGEVRGGSAGGASIQPTNKFQIVGGNTLDYLATVGIKKTLTTITSVPTGYANGYPANTPDGIGWIRSLDDNSYKICINDATSFINHDIPLGNIIYGMAASLSAADGSSYVVYKVGSYE